MKTSTKKPQNPGVELSQNKTSKHANISLFFTSLYWSTEGCVTISSNRTHTECRCSHLTNFAILMDVHGVELDEEDERNLDLITQIGCSVSIVCLVAASFCFLLLPGIGNIMRTKIHLNLCINLCM